jgi:hypothetical protein
MTPTAAIVLAGPERKRILRELLNLPEPWSLDTRELYSKMTMLEYLDNASVRYEDCLAAEVEKRTFGELVLEHTSVGEALEQARESGAKAVQDYKREHSPGRRERARRRTFREAVTACDGATAVTTGLVAACIVCGGPLRRGDSAYCRNACRQAAYRKRRNGQSQQKPIAAIQGARERQEMQRAARKAGFSQSQINECIRVANLPKEEFEELLEYPSQSTTDRLRSMRAAKRRQAAAGGAQ